MTALPMADCQYNSNAPAIPTLNPLPANQHYQNSEQHQHFQFQSDGHTVTLESKKIKQVICNDFSVLNTLVAMLVLYSLYNI